MKRLLIILAIGLFASPAFSAPETSCAVNHNGEPCPLETDYVVIEEYGGIMNIDNMTRPQAIYEDDFSELIDHTIGKAALATDGKFNVRQFKDDLEKIIRDLEN